MTDFERQNGMKSIMLHYFDIFDAFCVIKMRERILKGGLLIVVNQRHFIRPMMKTVTNM